MNYKDENSTTDQILVEKVLRGDTNAFSTIIKNTEGLVSQIVFKMVNNNEDRKDIAQDIYLKAFHKLQGFKFRSKLSTWIAQIAYNTCVNYLEKKKVVLLNHLSNEEEANEQLEVISGQAIELSNNEIFSLIVQKERSQILKNEINKLSPLYQTLITLYHKEELSYAEIAQITMLPEGTVKSYLFRARKTLRDNLLLTYKQNAL